MAKIRIKQVRSVIRQNKSKKQTMVALGLRRMHQVVEHKDTPQIRGMIQQVQHLTQVEEVK